MAAAQLLANDAPLGRVDPVNVEHALGDIQTDRRNLFVWWFNDYSDRRIRRHIGHYATDNHEANADCDRTQNGHPIACGNIIARVFGLGALVFR
jgi:hypothetical protein